jgi:crossover junction endodeoxyribonuclease RuvC
MTPILGIDIGTHGAVVILDAVTGQAVEIIDMPCLNDGPKGRPAVNGPLLAEFVFRSHATQAFVEYVGARPGEGAVGAFAFGRSRGVVEGVLGACGVPPGKEGAKDAARSEAIRRWPSQAALFARVKDDGRAEAALIAVAGLLRKGGAK